MVPEAAGTSTFWEHIYRYRFATRFAAHKRVLDIACGEGYGSAALRDAGAASVIGIDISEEACSHARQKYGIDARCGDADSIPLTDDSIELIVSFETVEHLTDPQLFLEECIRVLTPEGKLIISTPNREPYDEFAGSSLFHKFEMSAHEFSDLLATHFSRYKLYGQGATGAAWWDPRNLASNSSTRIRIKGAWRVRQLLRGFICPHVGHAPTEQDRRNTHQLILQKDNPLCDLGNPYRVHDWSKRDASMYVIAVATPWDKTANSKHVYAYDTSVLPKSNHGGVYEDIGGNVHI
jgi:SAM-dependent methyltransferase